MIEISVMKELSLILPVMYFLRQVPCICWRHYVLFSFTLSYHLRDTIVHSIRHCDVKIRVSMTKFPDIFRRYWKRLLTHWHVLSMLIHDDSVSFQFKVIMFMGISYGAKYSRMDQIKFVVDKLLKIWRGMVCFKQIISFQIF